MKRCSHKSLLTSMLTFLVFWAGSTVAIGEQSDKASEPKTSGIIDVELVEQAELPGDKAVNKNARFSLLGSPKSTAAASGPVPSGLKPDANPAPLVEALEEKTTVVSPPRQKAFSSQLGRGPGSSSKGEDYWQPVSGTAEAVEYEDLDAETSRDRFNADSIQNLRKPMRDIRIVAEENANAPKDLAARFMVKEPVLKIVAAGISPPQPDRYPIELRHRPLYYEQPHLERCGRSCGFAQNAISAGQFCMKTFFLPYHMCKTKPGCPIASSGDCLSCKPYSLNCNVLPLSYKGMASEAAAFAGFTFLLL